MGVGVGGESLFCIAFLFRRVHESFEKSKVQKKKKGGGSSLIWSSFGNFCCWC